MKDVFEHSNSAKYVAEFVGTFFLVFTVGCHVHSGNIGAALSIGAILMVMVYSLGSVSGAHFNPCVTLAVLLSDRNKISPADAGTYILVQLSGGLIGAMLSCTVFGAYVFQAPVAYAMSKVCAVEVLYSFALCYVVLNVATTEDKEQGNVPNSFFGLAIGLAVTSAAIAIGPISGCSLNPAVSVGGYMATRAFGAAGAVFPPVVHVIQYIMAPFFGAAIAAVFFFLVQGGISSKYEYRGGPDLESPPVQTLVQKPRAVILTKDMQYMLEKRHVNNDLFCGISWQVPSQEAVIDIDVSCCKFSSSGQSVYDEIKFSHKEGQEDKSYDPPRSIIELLGDNMEGHGEETMTASSIRRSKSKQGGIVDDERIEIRKLSRLMEVQPRTTYLFFVVKIFSSDVVFRNMKELTLRIVDKDNDEDILYWTKKDFSQQKLDSNAIIVGCLYCKAKQWFFKAIDQSFKIDPHRSHRELNSPMARIVQQIEKSGQEVSAPMSGPLSRRVKMEP
mmetsp:Transcript_36135/g.62780  ORF Transcript_36135/g.62780 Transcript_36135/m.62780 type:complete len:502 (+) Transcript_36135:85-1590(+)